jgi:hypothetical protein
MPRASHVRWTSSSKVIHFVKKYYQILIQLFDAISESPEDWNSDAIVAAMGFSNWLSRKSTFFFVTLFSEIYGLTDSLYEILQKKSLDIVFCNQSIADTTYALEQKASHYERFHESLEVDFLDNSPIERHFDPKRLFESVLNSVVTKMKGRFFDFKYLIFFELLDSSKFSSYSRNFPKEKFDMLEKIYIWQPFRHHSPPK